MLEELKKTLGEAESIVSKAVTASNIATPGSTTAGSLMARQDLQAEIVNLANRPTPLRDLLKRTPGVGTAFTYNKASSVYSATDNTNPREMIYADGGLPMYRTTAYNTVTAAYKSIGLGGAVTGLAEASGEAVVDLLAAEIEKTTRAVIQGEEWLLFWGDTTTTNSAGLTGFDGFDKLITTNSVAAGNATITKAMINSAAIKIAQQGGQMDRGYYFFTSIGVSADINDLYNNYSQVIINNPGRDAITYGNFITEIRTIRGVLKVVPTFMLNPGTIYPLSNGTSSFPAGATTSSAFIISPDFAEVKVLKELGMEMLGRVADKKQFYVNEYIALKVTAEPWMSKITGLKEPSVG